MHIGHYVKCPLFLSYINETWIVSTDIQKYSYNKLHGNPFSESRIVLCGRTDGERNRRTERRNEAKCRFSQFCERAWKAVSKMKFNHSVFLKFPISLFVLCIAIHSFIHTCIFKSVTLFLSRYPAQHKDSLKVLVIFMSLNSADGAVKKTGKRDRERDRK